MFDLTNDTSGAHHEPNCLLAIPFRKFVVAARRIDRIRRPQIERLSPTIVGLQALYFILAF